MISKKYRLGKNDTEWVLKKGEQLTTSLFVVRFLSPSKDSVSHPQFAIITSAKLSKKATERNFLKRRISEAIRLNIPEELPLKIAIIPKKRALDVEYDEINKDIQTLISKLNEQK